MRASDFAAGAVQHGARPHEADIGDRDVAVLRQGRLTKVLSFSSRVCSAGLNSCTTTTRSPSSQGTPNAAVRVNGQLRFTVVRTMVILEYGVATLGSGAGEDPGRGFSTMRLGNATTHHVSNGGYLPHLRAVVFSCPAV